MGVDRAPLLLLCAGKSTRMGGAPKGLLEHCGAPWVTWQLAAFAAAGGRAVVLVAAPETVERYGNALHACAERAARLAVDLCVNPTPERGPFSSLQVGLAATRRGAWVLPVDVPLADAETLCALARVLDGAGGATVPPRATAVPGPDAVIPEHDGRGGHPALLTSAFSTRLRGIDPARPDARLDTQLRAARTVRVRVADPRVTQNLNTPEDWAALRRVESDMSVAGGSCDARTMLHAVTYPPRDPP